MVQGQPLPGPTALGTNRSTPQDGDMTFSGQEPSRMPTHGNDGLEVLDEATSWELLRSQVIGRFGANRPEQGPLVVPVNYAVEADGEIVVRSGPGSKFDLASRSVVTLEVDEIDPVHHTGWSVVIEGLARVDYEDEAHADIDTWAPGWKPYVIRIRPTQISGRRIRLHTPDTDSRGYR